MTAITTSQPSSSPTPISVALDRTLGFYSNRMVRAGLGFEFAAGEEPNAMDRRALEHRRSQIAAWQATASVAWITQRLMAIALVRTPLRGDEADQDKALRISIATLFDVPQFALAKAFEAAHRGQVGKPEFVPTPAQLRIAAAAFAAPLYRERQRIDAILSAKVRVKSSSPERRKAIVEASRARMQQQSA